MDKNKIKKMGVFAGSLILSGTISYNVINNVFEVKPFNQNKYSIYKVDLKEYKENGIKNKAFYSKSGDFNKHILTNSIFIKTPFYSDSNGDIKRDVYSYDITMLTNKDIEFIIKNTGNNELILSQDYMKKINDTLDSNKGLLNDIPYLYYIQTEIINSMPPVNEMEIYYAEYDSNSHEIVYYNSKNLDSCLNCSYFFGNLFLAFVITNIYSKLKDKNKKRIRKIDNRKEE